MMDDVIDFETLRRACERCSLRDLCLPAGIAASDLDRLDSIVQKRRPLKPGDRLYRQGDLLGSVYVSRDAAFKTVAVDARGDEQIVAFHLQGELVGLDALGTGVYRCDAVALTGGTVCEVRFEQLSQIAAQLPSLQKQLLRVIGQSVGRGQDHMEILVRQQAGDRIALFLHGISERYARVGHSPTELRLPMSRLEMASFLGLAVETVSRGFKRLQDDAVIVASGREVAILDPGRIRALAHGVESLERPARTRGR